jgi:hypothetical protein
MTTDEFQMKSGFPPQDTIALLSWKAQSSSARPAPISKSRQSLVASLTMASSLAGPYKKQKSRTKARMDARTRERLPVLPALAAAVDRGRKDAAARLDAARAAPPGELFTAGGQTLRRACLARTRAPAATQNSPGAAYSGTALRSVDRH